MRAGLPAPIAGRFVKVCGLLASNHDGERAAAAAKATDMLRQHGLTWENVIACGCPKAADSSSPDWRRADHRARARHALLRASVLTPWEREFLNSIALRAAPLTERQAATLARIERKAGA
jgi:hypothetical protein